MALREENTTLSLYTNSSGNSTVVDGEKIDTADIIKICVLATTILVAVVANAIVCLVIYKKPSLHTNINTFVVSLCVSDFLNALLKMSTTLLSTVDRNWYPHWALCYITTPSGVLFGAASVFNLCAVALNQYFVIVHALRYPSLMTSSHIRRVITGLWISSVVISIPPVVWRDSKTICRSGAVSKENKISEAIYFSALWIFVVLIPSLLMLFSYSNIFLIAKKQILGMRTKSGAVIGVAQTRRKELRAAAVLALVGGIFILCWVPFFIVQTLLKFTAVQIDRIYFELFLCVMYSKSAINPFLFTFLNHDLKTAVKQYLSRLKSFRTGCHGNPLLDGKRNSSFTQTDSEHRTLSTTACTEL